MKGKKLWLFAAFALLLSVVTALFFMEDEIEVTEKEQTEFRAKVSVVPVPVQSHSGVIRTLAEVRPRWSATLKAHVAGEVVEVTPNALAGERVEKGDVLIRIEGSAYHAELANAQRELASANMILLQERAKARQATRDWKRSGLSTKPSALALNKPQLEIAEKNVASAKANVAAAKRRSDYTVVKAPFSGYVTERFVSVGQTVNIGEQLVSVFDHDLLDVAVSLDTDQWRHLATDWDSLEASIKSQNGELISSAKMKRGGGFLDPQSRQHRLFLEIKNDGKQTALAGDFVHVELPGKAVANTIRIPANAFTREGTVWWIDDQDRLRYFESDVVFYQNNELIVTAPANINDSNLRVVVAPLASFIAGKEVTPVVAGS